MKGIQGVPMDSDEWREAEGLAARSPGASRPALPEARPATARHLAAEILRQANWDLPPCPIVWSGRMSRCAGLFVVERDRRGAERPEIRLSIPLLRRRDWPWPVEVCGCNCRGPEDVVRRILEHELIHYKLWKDGEADFGHTERFRELAWAAFHHSSITHGIGLEG